MFIQLKKYVNNQYIGHFLILFLLILKISIELNSNYKSGSILPSYTKEKDWKNSTAFDDLELLQLGHIYNTKGEFYTNISFDRPKFRKDSIWKTALRNHFYVIYFSKIIKIINVTKNTSFSINSPNIYLIYHAKLMFVIKYLLLSIASFLFYFLLIDYFNKKTALFGIVLFLLYPSNFYVFYFNTFDSLCCSLVFILLSLIFYGYKFISNQKILLTLIFVFVLISGVTKFHIVLINICVMGLYIGYSIFKKIKISAIRSAYLTFLSSIFILLCYGLYNLKHINHFTISTQSSINFFHGHNPIAKGSWAGTIWNNYKTELSPLLLSKMTKLKADEYTESNAYKELGWEWILNNPEKEFLLICKKIAIFFYPHNFLSWNFNIITFMIHLGFFIHVILMFYKRRIQKIDIFCLAPVGVVLFLNIYFFVEYRWRFYTDSFMILSFIYIYTIIISKFQKYVKIL